MALVDFFNSYLNKQSASGLHDTRLNPRVVAFASVVAPFRLDLRDNSRLGTRLLFETSARQ
jgi:hypothetical protein